MTTEIVIRGGSWNSTAVICRSAIRYWNSPSGRDSYLGFRVLREKKKKEKKVEYRVLRGGSWSSPAGYCRSGFRYGFSPSFRFNFGLGFRVIKESKDDN